MSTKRHGGDAVEADDPQQAGLRFAKLAALAVVIAAILLAVKWYYWGLV